MKTLILNHYQLRSKVRFTDPFMHSHEKLESILEYFKAGNLRPPSLVAHNGKYLIFNGNHRVLVAIVNELEISCHVLENLRDVLQAQEDEGSRDRDLSDVNPLTFSSVTADLIASAEQWDSQDPYKWDF